jgi:thioredoxin-related protein
MRRRYHISLGAIAVMGIFACATYPNVAAQDWFVEFEPAQAAAQDQGKDLLIDFGGSDWCIPCGLLKERILSKPEFIELARERFILVDIDNLLQSEMPAGRKERYQALQKEYRVETFPSVVLATPEGKAYAWATYLSSINEPEEYWSYLAPLRERGLALRKHLRRARDLSGAARSAALVEALASIRADFAVRYYAKEILEIHELDPDDESGYLAFLQGRHDVESLQERLHKTKINPAAIEESTDERAELDAIAENVDELIDDCKLRGEALQEAILLRALFRVRAREPWKALEAFEAMLRAQATPTRFDRGDFLPFDDESMKTMAGRIAAGKANRNDPLGQWFALHRIFEFEMPDRYERSCGHGFRPRFLVRGWISEEYGRLLISTTADLPSEKRVLALRKGLEQTRLIVLSGGGGSMAEVYELEGDDGNGDQ